MKAFKIDFRVPSKRALAISFVIGCLFYLLYYFDQHKCVYVLRAKVKNKTQSNSSNNITTNRQSVNSVCGCKKDGLNTIRTKAKSLCGDSATARGYDQKVVAYTMDGGRRRGQEEVMKELEERVRDIKQKLADWTMRIYLDVRDLPHLDLLCSFHCKEPHVDICDVSALSSVLQEFGHEGVPSRRMWTFLPLLDPLVSVYLSRNAGSFISDREVHSLKEWMQSQWMFHSMVDHPSQGTGVAPGLWGVKTSMDRDLGTNLGKSILNSKIEIDGHQDIQIIVKYLQPEANKHMLCHASYKCEDLHCAEVRPFPTRRVGYNYVGYGKDKEEPSRELQKRSCPKQCRPKQHLDWEYC